MLCAGQSEGAGVLGALTNGNKDEMMTFDNSPNTEDRRNSQIIELSSCDEAVTLEVWAGCVRVDGTASLWVSR